MAETTMEKIVKELRRGPEGPTVVYVARDEEHAAWFISSMMSRYPDIADRMDRFQVEILEGEDG